MELSHSIVVETVLGQRWTERVYPFDKLEDLKDILFRRTGIEPHRQALVFGGRELNRDLCTLSSYGIREGSSLRLVVVARSGPSNNYVHPEVCRVDSTSLSENERSRRGCSAPEDTSAKESSAGEMEQLDEELNKRRLAKMTELSNPMRHQRRPRTMSGTSFIRETVHSQHDMSPPQQEDSLWIPHREEDVVTESRNDHGSGDEEGTAGHSKDRNQEADQPSSSYIGQSDPSELSSGMIICDLSQEFRKLKVRRRHHPSLPGLRVTRARSKPRGDREGSSSEEGEERTEEKERVLQLSLPARRIVPAARGRQLGVRTNAQLRCSVCAFKLTNTFNCRCGKSLCSRHRAAQAHTCSRGRRAQQVSD